MIVIADSSALVALSICECLPMLDVLFTEVKVPQEVYDEVCIAGKPEPQVLSGIIDLPDLLIDQGHGVTLFRLLPLADSIRATAYKMKGSK